MSRRLPGSMSEIERLLHLFVSLQILFGSRRGGWGFLMVLLIVGGGGYWLYQHWFSASAALGRADQQWNSQVTENRQAAIRQYEDLLQKRDPWEPQLFWLTHDRPRLYRRVIEYHVLFTRDHSTARDWVNNAWKERLWTLDFEDQEVTQFWDKVTGEIKERAKALGPLGGILVPDTPQFPMP